MIPILLAAASALVWGTADYAGGRATRRVPALWVTFWSKVLSLPVLALYVVLLGGTAVPAALAWGAAAGVAGMAALITFYRVLSGGAMSVVAPVAAVTTAVLPLTFGLATGDRPGVRALAGVACAVAAIGLVSLVPGPSGAAREPTLRTGLGPVAGGVAAGAGFGVFFVLLDRAGQAAAAAGVDGGLWPVAAAQAGALATGGLLLLRARSVGSVRATEPAGGSARSASTVAWLAIAGVFDMSANALYLVSVRDGMLSVVAPLAALYPVSTVLLALVLDGERVRPVQIAGLGLAVAALVLVAS